jgi:hypothetical protein
MIPALRRLRQEDYKFKPSVGYTVRPCLKELAAGGAGGKEVLHRGKGHVRTGSGAATRQGVLAATSRDKEP